MKRLIFALMLGMLVLAGCGNKNVCKVDGCNNPTFKEGYCKNHYERNLAESIGNNAADAIGGLFK